MLIVLVAVAVAPAMFLGSKWKAAVDSSRQAQESADPFRIAGNFYYVGSTFVSTFLITGPEGHIILDGGYPATGPVMVERIAKLGFNIKDVKVLINSQPRTDQAGGLWALQQASGAKLWTSEASADAIAAGGKDPHMPFPLRMAMQMGIATYPPPRVDHRFKDGETIRVGPISLTAHITGGSTPGCTSWSFPVRDGDRTLNVVSACGLEMVRGWGYSGQEADIERSLRVLRSLPADIWVTSNSRAWGRYRKFAASQSMKKPVDAFVDPEGYRAFIDSAEAEFRKGFAH